MQIETFEVIEQNDVEVENRDQCIELCKTLELEGQQELLSKDGKEICPYRKMTKEEHFVYSHILTQKTNYKKYSDGPIPLRVLQVLSHALTLSVFDSVEIWHAENADIRDPIAIGKKGQYDHEFFMLARWGEVLAPLAELKKLAVEKYRAECRAHLEEIKQSVEGKLNLLLTLSNEALAVSGEKFLPNYYGA
jgi:hypothetical protein